MNTEMLSLTLSEYLEAARVCLEYQKDERWPGPGCLGFPAGLLLFSVVDAIGSYVRGSSEVFDIDGKQRPIKHTGKEHFFVLNGAEYYGQALSEREIDHLYGEFRSLLAHNALFTPAGFLVMAASPELFPRVNNRMGVNLTAFYNRSVDVAGRFLAGHPDLHESKVMRHIRRLGPAS